ncbi:hypothetical protein K1719_009296 [Acacia pycnantha]|nr:hypothetical protein K1719_009296 [Acacia pycnantha]
MYKLKGGTGTDTANNASYGLIQLMRLKGLNHIFKDCEIPHFNSKDKIGSIELEERHGLYCPRYCSADSKLKDSKSLEIQVILESGFKCGRREKIDVAREEESCGKKLWWKNVFKSINKWLKYNGDWLEDMRGSLSLVATVIATITFQAALNPPGSIIQQAIRPSDPDFNFTSTFNASIDYGPLDCLCYIDESGSNSSSCPGEAILSHRDPYSFDQFITYNTISFVASLRVALLLVSGVPLKHRFVMWMLSIGMGITLTCLLNAYFVGLYLVISRSYPAKVVFIAISCFNGLDVLVGIYMAVIFVIWVVEKLNKLPMLKKLKDRFTKHRKSGGQGTGTDTSNNA